MNNNLFFIFSNLFNSSIELLFIIVTLYVYACDICYYSIMSSILQHLFFLVSLFYTLVRNIWFPSVVDVSDCIKHCFEHDHWSFSYQSRPYVIQWIYYQQKCIFLVGFKYTIANYNQCIIDITNSVHKLYQVNIFTDFMKNVVLSIS